MRAQIGRTGGACVAGVLVLMLLVAPVAAQVDVTGTWAMSVSTDQGITNPTMTLQQDGEAITGTYSSDIDRYQARLDELAGDLPRFVALLEASADADDPKSALLADGVDEEN